MIEAQKIRTLDYERVHDQFFEDNDEPGIVGLFDGMDAFHKKLIMLLKSKGEKSKKKIIEHFLGEMSKKKGYKILLMHNNIVAQNIIVKGDGIYAIVDWKLAKFFLEY